MWTIENVPNEVAKPHPLTATVNNAPMGETVGVVAHAVDHLVEEVTTTLQASGWTALSLQNRPFATFIRATRDGVIAVVKILPAGRDRWPVEIRLIIGVGYRPALDLMPLLTLPASGWLVLHDDDDAQPGWAVPVSSEDDAPAAAARLIALIGEHALAFARRFPDIDAIDVALQERWNSRNADPADDHGLTMQRLLLLTASGRHDAARALLATYTPAGRDDRRFVRQLHRWLDAGRTVIPPVEETLALLAWTPDVPDWSWAEAEAQVALMKEATESVRAQARGKSVGELAELLTVAYEQRGIEIPAVIIANEATALELRQRPFGRARSVLRRVRMLASLHGDMAGRLGDGFADDPSWLQPPERASFLVETLSGRHATIMLEPAAADFIGRVVAEAPARHGPFVHVDVWLDDHGSGLAAYIGDQRVGTLRPAEAAAFAAALRAAAIFDEALYVRGQLNDFDNAPTTLQIPLPE